MRKRSLGFLALGLVACAVDDPDLGSTAGMSFEELRASAPREPGTNGYVVDWDHVLHGDDALFEFWGHLQQGELAILTDHGDDVRWSDADKLRLTYCISDGFGANKQAVVDAMQAASDDGWEKLANVNFAYLATEDASCTADNANVVFDVGPIADAPYLARAFFPNDARAIRNVLVDASAFQLRGQITLARVLAHELGHVLGFRHEHIRPEAAAMDCVEDDQFRALTPYDAESVMHYPQCNGTSTTMAFTARDQEGVALVYGPAVSNPSPMAQITAPPDHATLPPRFTVEAHVVDQDLTKAELFVDRILYATLAAAPFQFAVADLAPGSHRLEVRGTDASGQVGAQTIGVTVASSEPSTAEEEARGEDSDLGEDSGGCDAAPGSSLLFGLGVIAAARRSRRRRPWRAAATSGPAPAA